MTLLLALLMTGPHLIAQDADCDFFDLPTPGASPQHFNPEILDLGGKFKFNVEIKSCDEIYFTTIDSKENIYLSKKTKGKWSKPVIASFSDSRYNDADPFLTKDGHKMYFISTRPTHPSDQNNDYNIWSVSRKNGKWTKPVPLPSPVNTEEYDEYFFSISDKGNAFFSSNRGGGEGSFDIYTVKVSGDNQFSQLKNAGQPISTAKYEFDPYISPDEKMIIFSINERGNSSLYYSFKDLNGQWTKPKNLGDQINITNQDFAPSLSADGKYLFFSNDGKLKWISTEILTDH